MAYRFFVLKEPPLDLGIEKWNDIINFLESTIDEYNEHFDKQIFIEEFRRLDQGSRNCALCAEYPSSCRKWLFWRCPVYAKTGKIGCGATPYTSFVYANGRFGVGSILEELSRLQSILECAIAERDFLRSLK